MDEGIIYLIVCSWSTEKQSQQSGFGRVLSVSLLKKACKRIKVAANVRFRTAKFIRPGRHADECLVPLLP